jgi:3-hydroxymyristoyl/3-hydroxydecanoyl-(acyl carrier protein) dehydratase
MTTLTLNIPVAHPAFAGHFPGRPILPGVVLLDLACLAIANATGIEPSGLSVVKFHRPVGPGAELQLRFDVLDTTIPFEIRDGEHKVAAGTLRRPEVAP